MMYLNCNLCDCIIPLSYDLDKTKFNLQVHFNGNRHLSNVNATSLNSFYADCNLCSTSIRMFTNLQLLKPYQDLSELLFHIFSQIHLDHINAYIDFQQGSNTVENESYNDSYYSEDDCYEEGYDETYEYSSEYAESGDSDNDFGDYNDANEYDDGDDDDDDDYDDDDNSSYEYRSPFFYCQLCRCKVPMTVKSNDATLYQIRMHINGHQHQVNLDDNENPNSLGCNLCQCYLQLSYNTDASMRNIETHIAGYRHCQKLPPLYEEDDDAYSSLIYQPD